MRLPWLLAILLAVLCATLLVRIGDQRRRDKDSLAKARDESAEFRGAFFKTQAELSDVDKDRAAQAATLQQLATHVAQKAAADLDQQKLMDDLRKKLDAKDGDVSAGGGIVTVHLESEVLFASGEAELSKRGREVLGRVGDVFKPLKDKQILVGGHTDDAPIHTARFPSNWELSTARAVNVVHFLADNVGVDPAKLTAAGYSQYHPRGSERALNRRIEILLIPQLGGPAPSGPAPSTTAPAAPATATPPPSGAK
jgi:chemotaxis protein MotB